MKYPRDPSHRSPDRRPSKTSVQISDSGKTCVTVDVFVRQQKSPQKFRFDFGWQVILNPEFFNQTINDRVKAVSFEIQQQNT